MLQKHDIVIVGAGICGLATALALHRKGIRSTVLERSETLRAAGVGIIMQPNGWRALDALGVASKLIDTALLLSAGEYITVENGNIDELPLGKNELRVLKRMDLIKALAEPLPSDHIQLGCCVLSLDVDPSTRCPRLRLQDGTTIEAKIVIGCDGLNSVVAKFLGIKPPTLFTKCSTRGFNWYERDHGLGAKFRLYSTDSVRFGHFSVTPTLVYWFLTRTLTPQDSGASKKGQMYIREATVKSMNKFPQHVVEMVKQSDLNSLHLTEMWYRTPWDILRNDFQKGTVAVAGDAMHAMCPFIGQGGCASLEDAVVLGRCLWERRENAEDALQKFMKERRMRVFWLSLQNYVMGLTMNQKSKVTRAVGILLLNLIFRDQEGHTDYDCGRL